MKQHFQATKTKGRMIAHRMALALSLLTGLVAVAGIAACSQPAPAPTAIPPTPEPTAALAA